MFCLSPTQLAYLYPVCALTSASACSPSFEANFQSRTQSFQICLFSAKLGCHPSIRCRVMAPGCFFKPENPPGGPGLPPPPGRSPVPEAQVWVSARGTEFFLENALNRPVFWGSPLGGPAPYPVLCDVMPCASYIVPWMSVSVFVHPYVWCHISSFTNGNVVPPSIFHLQCRAAWLALHLSFCVLGDRRRHQPWDDCTLDVAWVLE